MTNDAKIIIIQDLLDTKLRKEKELAYYNEELRKMEERMHWLRMEIKLTSDIIDMIEREKMLDIREWIRNKDDSDS